MKKVFLIVYLPGHAGHFLRFLFSIDQTTFPWVFKDKELNEINRSNNFYFDILHNEPKLWFTFHKNMIDQFDGLDMFINSDYEKQINIIHPHEFFSLMHNNLEYKDLQINYIGINFSQTNKNQLYNVVRPHIRKNEPEEDLLFKLTYDPFIINFDNFLSSKDLFMYEYERVNQYLDLPNYHDQAWNMLYTWKLARKIHLGADGGT